jgi:hypothetical protein
MRRQVVAVDIHTQLRGELEEISRMVSGLIKGLENRRAGGGVCEKSPGASHSR